MTMALSRKLAKARKLIGQAAAAKQRAAWRTPGTNTHLREIEKADRYSGEADALFDEIAPVLDALDAELNFALGNGKSSIAIDELVRALSGDSA